MFIFLSSPREHTNAYTRADTSSNPYTAEVYVEQFTASAPQKGTYAHTRKHYERKRKYKVEIPVEIVFREHDFTFCRGSSDHFHFQTLEVSEWFTP